MNEDVNKEEILDNDDVAPIEPSPTELEARQSGWVPKEEFTDDAEKWVDAGEFIRRGQLFRKIETQSRQLKDMAKAIQDIQSLHAKSREVEYKRALETVRAEKKTALEDGDADAVIEADDKMAMLREAQRESANQPAPQEHHGEENPVFVNWVAKNTWYSQHKGMKAFADTIGIEMRQQGLSPDDVLRKVEQEVRKEFPNRFVNPNQGKPSSVEGGTPNKGKSGKDNYQLSDQERGIMNNLVRLGVMTRDQYIDELKKVNGA